MLQAGTSLVETQAENVAAGDLVLIESDVESFRRNPRLLVDRLGVVSFPADVDAEPMLVRFRDTAQRSDTAAIEFPAARVVVEIKRKRVSLLIADPPWSRTQTGSERGAEVLRGTIESVVGVATSLLRQRP
jgi:hypothetical protein